MKSILTLVACAVMHTALARPVGRPVTHTGHHHSGRNDGSQLPASWSGRTEVSLDFGWRFFLGASTGGTCDTAYPQRLDGQQCFGLSEAPAGSESSEATCRNAACGVNAQVYQWCAGGDSCGAQSCWIGSVGDCNHTSPGWVSAAQNATAVWSPAASQPNFDDSAWPIIDIPHDFEITGEYNQSNNQGEVSAPFCRKYQYRNFVASTA